MNVSGIRHQGVVRFFNPEKGYGFCRRDGDADVFFHATVLRRSGIEHVSQGDRLDFIIENGEKGPKARDIRVVPRG